MIDLLDGFPGDLRKTSYPPFRNGISSKWNSGHPLARGLKFGIRVSADGLLQAWDFVNEIPWYQQNSGTIPAILGGSPTGSGIRFTSASTGYLIPSASISQSAKDAAYQQTGAVSIVAVANWPVGAASTGSPQTSWYSGGGGTAGYNCSSMFAIADKLNLYRAGASGADYYSAEDQSAGGGTNYNYSQLTTFGASQSGTFTGGAIKFYRAGVDTGSAVITHDMTGGASVTAGQSYEIGMFTYSSVRYNYLNGVLSMLYSWDRILDPSEFMAVQLDPWWAIRMEQTPDFSSYGISLARGRSRGFIIP